MKCAECDAEFPVPNDALEGELVTCPDCGSTYEVHRSPGGQLELKPAEATGEDWGE